MPLDSERRAVRYGTCDRRPVEWGQEICASESESRNEGNGMEKIGLRLPGVVGAAVWVGVDEHERANDHVS